jgi:hypothetical protein
MASRLAASIPPISSRCAASLTANPSFTGPASREPAYIWRICSAWR